MYNYLKQKSDSQLRTDQIKEANKKKGKGKQPKNIRFVGNYSTLKVVPKSKRTADNSNINGVALKK
ncbi:MAG: hypothetical protein M0R03_08695 [Novosphingobium sp.]|nr:hypothetical protein [Novosphingobium sp.]